MAEMRAARYDGYGGPEVLYEGTAPMPEARPGKVLVRVHAVSVNGIDAIVRAGILKAVTGRRFPRGTGLDFAGEVVTSGAPGFERGDRVWGVTTHGHGSAAEFVSVPPEHLASSPKNLDFVRAAALPAVGATALVALRDIAKLQAGETLLVRGASGGVGSIAVQLGRLMGARVTALAGATKLDLVRELGAAEAYDYATTAPEELGTFDVVFDTVGRQTGAYRRLLARRGRMVTICPDPDRPIASMLTVLASGVFGTRRVRFFSAKPRTPVLRDLAALVEAGTIRPIVGAVRPLRDIAETHRAMERGGSPGKQVVRIL